LAIPVVGSMSALTTVKTSKPTALGISALVLLGILLYASQLFYAWYMVIYFAG
jgi:hypothetical protein